MGVSYLEANTVVIVDDSRTIQAMLETAFETSGDFRVVGVASDAVTAAAMIRKLRPDLVTIDLCMPYIDGAALLDMVTGLDQVCKIVISDHAATNAVMAAKLRRLGAAACVGKTELAASNAAFLRKIKAVLAAFTASARAVRSATDRDADEPQKARRATSAPSIVPFPIPVDERERLDYLRRKQLANAMPDRQFDLVTSYVARSTSFPICLLNFIDRDTQWMKSAYGLTPGSVPRGEAFCNYTIARDDVFVVRDAANDGTFAQYPGVVGDPHIRTYVGQPIITEEGIHAGALCVIDTKVRVVPDGLITQLRDMAGIVAEMINRKPALAA